MDNRNSKLKWYVIYLFHTDMPTGSRKKYLIICALIFAPAYAAAGTVDTQKVEETWLQWNNDLRATMELRPYTIDNRLSTTAKEWSDLAAERDSIDHKRLPTDGYYNYSGIENRFLDHGLKFKNINRATFSESLGYGYFACKKAECTEDLIKAVKSTWNFYMREQPKMGPHYKALVHPYFQTMGLGITVDEKAKRYYLTIHYASEVVAFNKVAAVSYVQPAKALPVFKTIKDPVTNRRRMIPIQ